MKRLNVPLEEVPITTTRTHDVYVGVPLCDMSNSGVVVQGIVREDLEERYGVKATVSTGETNCNGNKLGPNSTTHEFFMLDKRNEVKQAQLRVDTSKNRWYGSGKMSSTPYMMCSHESVHTVGMYVFRARWQVWRFDAGESTRPLWWRSTMRMVHAINMTSTPRRKSLMRQAKVYVLQAPYL